MSAIRDWCIALLAGTTTATTPHIAERAKPKPAVHRPAPQRVAKPAPQPAPQPTASAPISAPCVSVGMIATPGFSPDFARPSLPTPRGPLGWVEPPLRGPGFAAGAPGSVPEPETWGMLVLGFGLVGVAARRKSQRSKSA